eukprot:evm.model.NODE_9938_length_23979_cov_25.075108.3
MGYQVEISVALPLSGGNDEVDIQDEAARATKALSAMDDTITARLQAAAAGLQTDRFTMPQLATALAAIDRTAWLDRLTSTATGADVWQTVSTSGDIGLREFAAWCRLEERVENILSFVGQHYPDAVLRERQATKARFEIPSKDTTTGAPRQLSEMFGLIEEHKVRLYIEDYSVSQTSLEQIFNFFAGQQEEEKGAAAGIVSGGPLLAIGPAAALGATQQGNGGAMDRTNNSGGGSNVIPSASVV